MGWRAVPFGENADIVIINTCTVTDNSDKKCRNYIRQGSRSAQSGRVVVVGCLARRDPTGIAAMEEVAAVIDNRDRATLTDRILSSSGFTAEMNPSFSEESSLPYGHRRAFLRIQDGCDGKCSYCIVPSVRGAPSSRPFDEVMRHAQKLIESGVREIVLTGITIGCYESGGNDLSSLAGALCELPGNFRIRITSVEPRHLTSRLADAYAHPKLCPHIHLPLQSGSDSVLARMKRPYTMSEYSGALSLIRSVREDIAVGTDIIVGFPGESDDEFAETLAAVERFRFAHLHQFNYSPRSGTDAAKEKICDHAVVTARLAALKRKSEILSREFIGQFEGKRVDAIVEQKGEKLSALTGHYLRFPIDDDGVIRAGDLLMVKIVRQGDNLTAVAE
jgi:threonylcarbamoyladenosine tRNA methylthiotransferase MtaB